MDHIHIKIDGKTKEEAQIKAIKQGDSLTKVIINLLKKWLKAKGE